MLHSRTRSGVPSTSAWVRKGACRQPRATTYQPLAHAVTAALNKNDDQYCTQHSGDNADWVHFFFSFPGKAA
jgi:hypothetical protein